ncbi:MAG TPA: ATP-binding protein [Fervidobacterium sp.]|nr:ATP-binding protein [Fervidobacterium sp.]
MNITTFKNTVPNLFKAKISTMLWGGAGIGKTSIVKQIAKDMGYNFIYLTLASVEDNSDLIGLLSPLKDKDGNDYAVRHLRPDWFPETPKNLILIDEANRMPKSIIQSMLTFILDKKLHTHILPEDTHFILLANPPTDQFIVGDFSDEALVSRLCHIPLEPTVEEWLENAVRSGVDDSVTAFIHENPECLEESSVSYLPTLKPFRRSWHDFVSPFIQTNPLEESLFEVVRGLVGTPMAVKYLSFRKYSGKKIRGREVLSGYDQLMASEVSKYENNLDVINIINEEIIREIKIANTLTQPQADNLAKYLQDIPIEIAFNASREILGLGLVAINNTLGQNQSLLEKLKNKMDDLLVKQGEEAQKKIDEKFKDESAPLDPAAMSEVAVTEGESVVDSVDNNVQDTEELLNKEENLTESQEA